MGTATENWQMSLTSGQYVKTRQDKIRQDKTRQDKTRQDWLLYLSKINFQLLTRIQKTQV